MSNPAKTRMARAKSDKQRQALIEAAIRVVAREGHPGATVGALAKEAGLAAGIVSFYFGGKDKLQALIEDAHTICPYSKATKGNVPVKLTAV